MLQDIRFALRMMRGHPFFTAMAVLSLALGIGANTAVYSFMDSILLGALPVQNPKSLVVLNWHGRGDTPLARHFSGSTHKDDRFGTVSGNFPYPVFDLFRDDNPVFSTVFAFNDAGRLNAQIGGQADLASTQYVSGAYFSGLGVPPAAGRLIGAGDDRPGAPAVAVLSFRYAEKRFGNPTEATGKAMRINDHPFVIVGVSAPEFFGVNPSGAQDIFVPMHTSAFLNWRWPEEEKTKYADSHFYWVEMMGRLRPGVTLAQAQAALSGPFHNYIASTASNDKERAALPELLLQEGAGGLDWLRRQFSKPLYILITMVGLILAIACANIANLLLSRSAGRRREMAVRLSLGAGRLRIVRQLLTESVLLAAIGGLLGVAFAAWGIRALTLLIANGRENFTLYAALNWRVLGITAGLSVITGLLFGLAPALQSTHVDLVTALKQTRAGEIRLRLRSWLRPSLSQALVVSQIAISLLLVAAAGLFVRTLSNLNSIQLGFNSERVLLVSLDASQAGYKDAAILRFYSDLRNAMAAIPGVRSVTSSNYALVSGSRSSTNVILPGLPEKNRGTNVLDVGPGFFSTMQIPILLGREIDERDGTGAARVAVVNEVFVRTYFGGRNPIGQHFGLGAKRGKDLEIIGVAKSARFNSLKQDIAEVVYVPYQQNPWGLVNRMVYEVRAAGDPAAVASAVRQAVRQSDARVPISNLVTQEKQIDQTIGPERIFATLCTCFAVLALLIACVGLYGMMAHSVARRTNEIGIRMALGAERRRLIWMVLREVIVMTAAGLAIGLPVVLASSKALESFLFQMKPNDPATMAAAVVILAAAAVAAGYGPAWRASRIDPWTALRDE